MAKEFAQPLVLTTPHMKGQKVKDAQYLMAGHSRFKGLATYKHGTIDGDYGLLSVQACRRAKFWLGYPLAAVNGKTGGVFGQTMYEYLRPTHWRPLPDEYRKRRDARIAATSKTPGQKALALAKKELGYHESPAYSNRTKFGLEYGFNGVAWCAIFESIMFKHAGFPRFRYAAVEAIYNDAIYGRNSLRRVFSPRQGDIVCYALHGDPFAHTAFYDVSSSSGQFWDVGGNTSAQDFSNGGEVARQLRSTRLVHAYVRYDG